MSLAEPTLSAPVPHHGLSVSSVLLVLWLSGTFVFLLRWLRDWWQIRAIVREASPQALPVDLPVLVTPQMIEPGVVGLFRPVLLLPEQILRHLSEDQLRAILAHESCHVQRRDNLAGAIHMLVEVIFWFHPAVWWIERCLITEREAACDETVLQLGNEAEVYAESILNVCKFYTESPLVCMSGVTGSELKQRIVRILTELPGTRLSTGRKILLSLVTLTVLSVPVLSGLVRSTDVHAQSTSPSSASKIVATWQGTLHTDRDYQFVVKVTPADNGSLRSTFYNLTGRPGGLPGFSTVFSGSALKIDFGFATYDGTLGADGNLLTGRWHQGSDSQPLTFLRASAETGWSIPQPPPPPTPMASDADPAFEVSTIKPSGPDERGPRYMFDHRRFSVVHLTLSQLIQYAYDVQEKQISGMPEWVRTESYDVGAQPGGEGEPSSKQWQAMVKKLMAERFQLKLHDDNREMSIYVLTLATSGPKFARSQSNPNGETGLGFGPGNMGATNATVADVAEAMQQGAVDRPVVDQTGLSGRFDLRLRWTPADSPAGPQSDDAPPDLFTAMQEQLGLRMVAKKAPVRVLVMDRAQKPTAN